MNTKDLVSDIGLSKLTNNQSGCAAFMESSSRSSQSAYPTLRTKTH